jgi:hypothetical protein
VIILISGEDCYVYRIRSKSYPWESWSHPYSKIMPLHHLFANTAFLGSQNIKLLVVILGINVLNKSFLITNPPKTLKSCYQRRRLWAKTLVITILLIYCDTSWAIVENRLNYQVVKNREFEKDLIALSHC